MGSPGAGKISMSVAALTDGAVWSGGDLRNRAVMPLIVAIDIGERPAFLR